jgi:hypothetical protein
MVANVIIHDSSEDKQPEKYGRTLARDIEILKEGGIPDLAPLAQSAPKERPATPPPVEGPPSPPHAHTLTPPLVTPIEPHYSSKERLVAASHIAPTPPMPVSTTESPPSLPRARTPAPPLVSPIKTYSGDFLEMVKETHASTATVLAAEQDKKQKWVPQEAPKKSRSNLLYVIAGAVLLIAGGTGAYVAYTRYLSAVVPIVPTFGARAPIFVDEREQLIGSGATLFRAVETSLARPPTPNAVRLLYNNTDTNIFSTLLAGAPDIVLRNTNADDSMVGIVNAAGSTSVFFILSVSSYSNTFSGMLFWEKSIPRDLAALWGAYPSLTGATVSTSPAGSGKAGSGQATASSTSSGQATTTRATGFRDEVIANHDARVYRDSAGRSILLYGYWNQATLVIARDPIAFAEILQRLATSRAQ